MALAMGNNIFHFLLNYVNIQRKESIGGEEE